MSVNPVVNCNFHNNSFLIKWLKENNPEHYLSEWLIKGKSYCTINNHRSAISAFHKSIVGVRIGQHELTCKLVGDCLNANPPQYNPDMWWLGGVEKVCAYILHYYKRCILEEAHYKAHLGGTIYKQGRTSFGLPFCIIYAVISYEGLWIGNFISVGIKIAISPQTKVR